MGSPYFVDYRGRFELPLPAEEAWKFLQRTDLYETWWPWVRDLSVDGPGIAAGTTFSFRVVAPVPYRMRLRVEVDETHSFGAHGSVTGDLEGEGGIEVRNAGEASTVELFYRVTIKQPQMRFAARVAGPLLRWGQTWAIQSALKGFIRHIEGPGV